MRSYVPNFEMITPKNLDEALTLLADRAAGWKPCAGGTDLMVLFEAGKLNHTKFVNIAALTELHGIEERSDAIEIKALTTYTDILKHATIQREFPSLVTAAALTGAVAIQNRGTIGGNIVNASPAADSPPALLAYDAQVELISVKGVRRLAYADFHKGYKQMDLQPGELLKSVLLPRTHAELHHYYRKVGTRRAQAISKVCFCGVVEREDRIKNIRIALGSVAPIPLRARRTETFLIGKQLSSKIIDEAKKIIDQEISPIDDIRSTAKYRRRVTQNLLEEFLCGTGSTN
ncbi:MAG: xanthine dehydrogenase family protein subunit M [Deltaproteobacteria bacterium]|nr:xanthine dehydrogenase family protein subunit M [Deltaproteobacteria bacterium]